MRKLIATTAALSLVASGAFAGGLAPIAEPIVIEDEATSSAADYIVPLIFLGMVAIAMSADSDDDEPTPE